MEITTVLTTLLLPVVASIAGNDKSLKLHFECHLRPEDEEKGKLFCGTRGKMVKCISPSARDHLGTKFSIFSNLLHKLLFPIDRLRLPHNSMVLLSNSPKNENRHFSGLIV